MNETYVPMAVAVKAVQWFPDPAYGEWRKRGSRKTAYCNKKIGYDAVGVEYTIMDVGVHGKRGFQKIQPGDWIVTATTGTKMVLSPYEFELLYRVADWALGK